MSISFTPSQSHAILICHLAHQASLYGHTCDELEDLREVYLASHPEVLESRSLRGYVDRDAVNEEINRLIFSDVILVVRAYCRFRKELQYYLNRKGGLKAVKQYHSLLVDTLAPFLPK